MEALQRLQMEIEAWHIETAVHGTYDIGSNV